MNLSIKDFLKPGLLLLTALVFITCKKENHTLGLDSSTRLDATTIRTDTFTITSSVFLAKDSVISSYVDSFFLCGAYADPFFGSLSAEANTQIRLRNEFKELPNATPDSAILYLRYKKVYGNIYSAQTLNVFPLTDDLIAANTYYTDSPAPNRSSTAIGTDTFIPANLPDSIIRIKIADTNYLKSILNGPKQNASFISQFKGLAIVPGNPTADAAIFTVDRLSVDTDTNSLYYKSPKTILRIFYHLPGNSNQLSYELTMDVNAKKFHKLIPNRSSSALSALSTQSYVTTSTSSLYNQGYVQAGTGLLTKINFPYLDHFLATVGSINIHNAQIQITAAPGSTSLPLVKGMILVDTDSTNVLKRASANINYYSSVQPDGYPQSGYAYPESSTLSNTTYTFTISDYIQALYLKKRVCNGLVFYPYLFVPYYNISLNYNNTSVDRLVFGDNSNTVNPMKLIIYYTSVK